MASSPQEISTSSLAANSPTSQRVVETIVLDGRITADTTPGVVS